MKRLIAVLSAGLLAGTPAWGQYAKLEKECVRLHPVFEDLSVRQEVIDAIGKGQAENDIELYPKFLGEERVLLLKITPSDFLRDFQAVSGVYCIGVFKFKQNNFVMLGKLEGDTVFIFYSPRHSMWVVQPPGSEPIPLETFRR